MNESSKVPTPSTATIMQHPVHPTLVVFPIAFLISTFVSDGVFLLTDRGFWAEVSFWLVSAGLAMGLVAAIVGMIDFFTMREVRKHVSGWSHFLAGVMTLALAATQVQLRWDDPEAAVWPVGIVLSAAMVGVVAVTGWLGGTLTFKHGIGTYGFEFAEEDGEDAPPKE